MALSLRRIRISWKRRMLMTKSQILHLEIPKEERMSKLGIWR
jgi:hypothetical protein